MANSFVNAKVDLTTTDNTTLYTTPTANVSLKIANTAAQQNWKLGGFRLDIQPDGRR